MISIVYTPLDLAIDSFPNTGSMCSHTHTRTHAYTHCMHARTHTHTAYYLPPPSLPLSLSPSIVVFLYTCGSVGEFCTECLSLSRALNCRYCISQDDTSLPSPQHRCQLSPLCSNETQSHIITAPTNCSAIEPPMIHLVISCNDIHSSLVISRFTANQHNTTHLLYSVAAHMYEKHCSHLHLIAFCFNHNWSFPLDNTLFWSRTRRNCYQYRRDQSWCYLEQY